jgi:hypothetical protein
MKEHVGRTYLFDYGDLVIGVKYLSEHRLAWEQIRGPEAGRKAEEECWHASVRPAIHLVWWQEKDSSIVIQVVDLEMGRVFTTWVSPDKQVTSFQGTVRAGTW